MTYYSEWEPFASDWLRNLCAGGVIPPGVVDSSDIRRVNADGLRGFDNHHLFAGLGGWPAALALAGWPRGIGTLSASCPCQPFSTAGKRKGTDDERHLWPFAFAIIRGLRPEFVFGEQVSGRLGVEWAESVRADLRSIGYEFCIADVPAGGLGAPHKRNRLFWCAHRLPDVQEVWGGEVVIGVLQAQGLVERTPSGLQGVLPGQDEPVQEEAGSEGAQRGGLLEVPAGEPGEVPDHHGEAQGDGQGHPVHPLAGGHRPPSGGHRRGALSGDGAAVRPGQREGVEQSVDRPDRLESGLHAGERPGDALLRERDGEHMGGREGRRDRGGDSWSAGGEAIRLSEQAFGAAEVDDLARLLAGIFAELEGHADGERDGDSSACGVAEENESVTVADAAGSRQAGREDAGADSGDAVTIECGRGEPERSLPTGTVADAERGGVRGGGHGEDGGAASGVSGEDGQRERLRADAGAGGGDERGGLEHAEHGRQAVEEPRTEPGASGGGACPDEFLADAHGRGRGGEGLRLPERRPRQPVPDASGAGEDVRADGVGDPQREGLQGQRRECELRGCREEGEAVRPGRERPARFWDDSRVIACRDGKARRVPTEPRLFPLADGVPRKLESLLAWLRECGVGEKDARRLLRESGRNRTGRLKAAGNAICVPVGAAFVRCVMDEYGIEPEESRPC